MARAAGGRLGPLLELSTEDSGPRPVYRSTQLYKASAMAAPTPIEPGELTLRVGLTARWQFVPNQ